MWRLLTSPYELKCIWHNKQGPSPPPIAITFDLGSNNSVAARGQLASLPWFLSLFVGISYIYLDFLLSKLSSGAQSKTHDRAHIKNRINLQTAVWQPVLVSAAIAGFHVTSRQPCWCNSSEKKSSGNFDSSIMQNMNDILPLFCTQTWPFHHVSENHCRPIVHVEL